MRVRYTPVCLEVRSDWGSMGEARRRTFVVVKD